MYPCTWPPGRLPLGARESANIDNNKWPERAAYEPRFIYWLEFPLGNARPVQSHVLLSQ